ncbi:hypothetical protein ACS0TY_011424 [Phlomoides rotata]
MASMMGVWVFCQSLLHTVFPAEIRSAFLNFLHRVFSNFSAYCYYDITEIDGVNTNELYDAVQLYLSSFASITGTRLSLTRGLNSSSITFGLSNTDRIIDFYKGATVEWEHLVTPRQGPIISSQPLPEEKRGFTLRVRKKNKQLVLDSYLDFVMERANELRRKNEDRLLYTYSGREWGPPWESVPFKHPSTFDTLAMDPVKKGEIMADLLEFANGESFYQKIGRAWKRGYLLYGPPGTGKSSMIAAMANFLRYDIYDLELTEVKTNSQLRKLLMKTSSKSIIVIEDIDCSIDLTNRNKSGGKGRASPPEADGGEEGLNTITLSGLLNFTDGLSSCCGSERIFVFTTNHVDNLDPALLRSGRMDMHIHMSYCSFPSLKILLKNYLGYEEPDLKKEFEVVVDAAAMTPADISEVLIKNRRDKNKAIDELLDVLKIKGEKNRLKLSNGSNVEDEKRALESPKESSDQLLEKFEEKEGHAVLEEDDINNDGKMQ